MDKMERRYDLDWMRVILILLVFIFHSGRAFNFFPYHVEDTVKSMGATQFQQFLLAWMLPMIFIISGAGIWYGLGYQKAGRFIWGKVLRLLVPFVFAIFVLSPHQVYLERINHGQFSGSFFQWFPHYFEGVYGLDGGNFTVFGLHLWYLIVLFLYSLIFLPLFMLLHSKVGRPIVKGFGSIFKIPGLIYVMGLILALPIAYINPETILGMRGFGDWNLVYYAIVLIFGFLCFADDRVQASIVRQRWVSLIVGIVLYLMYRVFHIIPKSPVLPLGSFHEVMVSWCLVMGFLGFGMKYLCGTNGFLKYSTEAVLSFYILHQPVILVIAFWVVQLQLPVLAKYIIIAVLSFVIIIGLYEVIKRIGVLRLLFGMKLRKAVAKVQE